MKIPTPDRHVRRSKIEQSIVALNLFGRNWAMGAIWHLYHQGPSTFRKLRDYCKSISLTILNKRLKELTEPYLIKRTLDRYVLTQHGKELYQLIEPLGGWARHSYT